MTQDALAAVRQAHPGLRPAEQRVADAVLADPVAIVTMSVSDLAERCNTSVATVVRFCQAAGFAGYGDLRLQLASSQGRQEVTLGRFGVSDAEIDPDDDAADVLAKIAYHEARAIEATAGSIDLDTLDAVADAVIAADRVDIYGVASSSLAAIDLQHKLHRVGLVSFYYSDIHLALTSAAVLTDRSVSVGFSHSGRTVETVESLTTAQQMGATTVAVTNFPHSPVTDHADHVLLTSAAETRFRPGAMSSRIAQLAVVDFLFVRLVQRSQLHNLPSFRGTYDAVQQHRLPQRRTSQGRPRP